MRTEGATRYILGLALVVVSILLMLDSFGVLGLDIGGSLLGTWGPTLLILSGGGLFSGGFRFRTWPVIVLLLGADFQWAELGGWESGVVQLWPLLLGIVGLALLLGGLNWRGPAHPDHRHGGGSQFLWHGGDGGGYGGGGGDVGGGGDGGGI